MLKKVLWIAAACAAILVALAVSRGLDFDKPVEDQPAAAREEAVQDAAPPLAPVETAPAAPVVTEAPPTSSAPTLDEQQIQDDAAATGMTTMEPEVSPPTDSPPT